MDGITENLRRAQEAISRARTLSTQLTNLCMKPEGEGGEPPPSPLSEVLLAAPRSPPPPPPPGPDASAACPERPLASSLACTDEEQAPSGSGRLAEADDVDMAAGSMDVEAAPGVAPGHCEEHATLAALSGPVLAVAQQLASLQRRQTETLQQLLVLRLQQLKLRQQQLTALQELLVAEAAVVEGTPLQVAAVEQAVGLLGQSLGDMQAASRAMMLSQPGEVQSVSAAVSATDVRADEVSRMARQLLGVLRAFPRRTGASDQDSIPGASADTIASIPSLTCPASSPLLEQTCCICLGAFAEGDTLKSIQCVHYHHAACLDEWLRIKACCPLCKAVLLDSTS